MTIDETLFSVLESPLFFVGCLVGGLIFGVVSLFLLREPAEPLVDRWTVKSPIGAIVEIKGENTALIFGDGHFEVAGEKPVQVTYLYDDDKRLEAGVLFELRNSGRTTVFFPPGDISKYIGETVP